MEDVIAAASSTTTTAATSQMNQKDPTTGLETMTISSNDTLTSQTSMTTTASVLEMSKTETGTLDTKKLSMKESNQANTSTIATTITSIVSPIVIPSFKVGMGTINKEIVETESTNEINPSALKASTDIFLPHQPQQGIFI